jgi:hypothetical protein
MKNIPSNCSFGSEGTVNPFHAIALRSLTLNMWWWWWWWWWLPRLYSVHGGGAISVNRFGKKDSEVLGDKTIANVTLHMTNPTWPDLGLNEVSGDWKPWNNGKSFTGSQCIFKTTPSFFLFIVSSQNNLHFYWYQGSSPKQTWAVLG